MPLYLADTSAWNRSTAVADRWESLVEADEIALCTPVVLELLWSARSRREYRELARDLASLRSLPFPPAAEATAQRTQALLSERSHHRGAGAVDLLIAAVAAAHRAVLLHYDRHFDAIARATGQPTEWISRRGSLD